MPETVESKGSGFPDYTIVTAERELSIRISEEGGYTYVGYAPVGSSEDEAKWMIFRVDDNGNVYYAEGNAKFNKKWSERTSYTYS